jgi:hypothetical protein
VKKKNNSLKIINPKGGGWESLLKPISFTSLIELCLIEKYSFMEEYI